MVGEGSIGCSILLCHNKIALVLTIADGSLSFSCRKKRRGLRFYDDGGGTGKGIYVFGRLSDSSEYGFRWLELFCYSGRFSVL
jgi:hypothetical protein